MKNTPTNTLRPKPGCVGDVNGDGKINLVDLVHVLKVLGTRPGQPGWVPAADVNGDQRVDLCDLRIVMKGKCHRN